MRLSATVRGTTFSFADVREVMARSNEDKSGDHLAGVAARSALERVAAKLVLSELTLADLHEHPCVPYADDAVTRLIWDRLAQPMYQEVKGWTIGQLREHVLDDRVSGPDLLRLGRGLTSEMIAACAKLMSNLDLVVAARKIRVVVHANNTLGQEGRLGVRLQPNHPSDSLEGILASIKDGVAFGCGDAVLGINPVTDDVASCKAILDLTHQFITDWRIPTQNCCLAHVTTQMKALAEGAKLHLMFQSLCGTEKGLTAFGVTIPMLHEAHDMTRRLGQATGPNVMYFETGQGSALSADAHHGVDQLTCEARNYGIAREFAPFLLNTVVGFIGPEYLFDARQITRAGLEDHFMGKLHGIPMGCDACYTNHADADQNDLENLKVLLATAGCNFFMGLPMGDDVMLNYQSSSFHDDASVRQLLGLRPAPEFEAWLEEVGLMQNGKLTARAGDASFFDVIDRKQIEALVRGALVDALGEASGRERVTPASGDAGGALVIGPDRGVNLEGAADQAALAAMIAAQPARIAVGRAGVRYRTNTLLRFRADHAAAKDAVTSEVEPALLERLGLFEVRTRATDKRHFLQRPDAGRALSDEARAEIARRIPRAPQLQVIYGDGLSAAALNQHLEAFHRALDRELASAGVRVSPAFFVRYSRVKVMDEIARLVDAESALFVCGERPGLGYSDSLSAYYIYKPGEGATDANREVISNINPRGIEPARAARLTAEAIARILRDRKSGVQAGYRRQEGRAVSVEVRVLVAAEADVLEAFLLRHADSSMFLRANARAAGLDYHGQPLGAVYAGAFEDGALVGVAAHAWNGILLVQAPAHLQEVVREAVRASGRAVAGMTGPFQQVQAARVVLGLGSARATLDSRDELFALDLGDLRLPAPLADGTLSARLTTAADDELCARWRVDYSIELLGVAAGPELDARARVDVESGRERQSAWLLVAGGEPVATSSFNARLPDVVQIGGVFTPPRWRGRGYARAVVAASLLDARAAGVRRAILFTGESNLPARLAYQSLGFHVIGEYGLLLLAPT